MSIAAILSVARGELGYLEKRSDAFLQDKTANAGSSNFTKYGAWYGLNGEPWCDMFVCWCAHQAGEAEAVGHFAYVPYHVAWFRKQGTYFARGCGTPRPGDVIFFREACHVGLVEEVSGGYVTTIEGNTSGGSTLVSNGGGVFEKTYSLSSSYIMGYGRPLYGNADQKPSVADSQALRVYQNGATEEPVYADTGLTIKVGSLNPWETCDCLGTVDGRYIVRYPVDGTEVHKVGVVAYDGAA